jgi:hypothetical protein
MALATYKGPGRIFTFARLTFRKGEARPVPAEVVAQLSAHPWFSVEGVDDAGGEAPPRRRGRPRKKA